MRQPQTIWSLCAFIFGLMGIIFVFLGMLFYITDIPVNGGCNWSFIPIGAILLLGSIVCLAQLEHKDICKLARAMLSVGRSMLLLLWRTDLYSQKPLVMDKAGY